MCKSVAENSNLPLNAYDPILMEGWMEKHNKGTRQSCREHAHYTRFGQEAMVCNEDARAALFQKTANV
jgi:hypothetical protein